MRSRRGTLQQQQQQQQQQERGLWTAALEGRSDPPDSACQPITARIAILADVAQHRAWGWSLLGHTGLVPAPTEIQIMRRDNYYCKLAH